MADLMRRERIVPLTDQEVDRLATRYVTGEVFVAWTPQAFQASFGTFMALAASQLPVPWLADVASGWAEMDKAAQLAVNGMPQFFSCNMLTTSDIERLQRAVLVKEVAIGKKEQSVLDQFDADFEYWASLVDEDPGKPFMDERERLIQAWVDGADVDEELLANEAAMAEARGPWFSEKWAARMEARS